MRHDMVGTNVPPNWVDCSLGDDFERLVIRIVDMGLWVLPRVFAASMFVCEQQLCDVLQETSPYNEVAAPAYKPQNTDCTSVGQIAEDVGRNVYRLSRAAIVMRECRSFT